MANMSYCRFRNTLADLRECQGHLGDEVGDDEEEERARKRLIQLCIKIASDFEGELP